MHDDLHARIELARRQLAKRDQLNQSLLQQRERLKQEGFRHCRLETGLAWIDEEIHKLESFSLDGLMASLLGGKQQKLEAKREEAQAMQAEFDECLKTLTAIDGDIKNIEEELAKLADADAGYQALCDEKQNRILAGSDENAKRLTELSSALERLATERRRISKATQIGSHLDVRLQCMMTAVLRTKGAAGFSTCGVLLHAAGEALARRGARGPVDRVVEGFDEFRELLATMELSGGSTTDQELMQLIAEIDQFAAQMDHGAAFDSEAPRAMRECIKDLVGHLEDRGKQLDQQIKETEAQRLRVLDND